MNDEVARPRLRDRIGVISAVSLFLIAVASLIALAAIGFKPALYLLVVAIVGAALVIYGARLHGPRS